MEYLWERIVYDSIQWLINQFMSSTYKSRSYSLDQIQRVIREFQYRAQKREQQLVESLHLNNELRCSICLKLKKDKIYAFQIYLHTSR